MTLNYKNELKFFGAVTLGAGVFAAAVFTLGNVNNLDHVATNAIAIGGDTIDRIEPVFSDPNGVRLDRLAPQPRRQVRAEVTQQEVETFENNYHRGMCEYWANNPSMAGNVQQYEQAANVDCGRWGF